MDKSKSKDDLRAAGKKRLEEFRQKRQQKGSSNKSSGTAIKVLADDESLSGISVAPVSSATQQDTELHQKADGEDTNVAETLELGVEAPQQVQSSPDESPVQSDTQSEMSLADDESLSGISVAPVSSATQQDIESHQMADGEGTNVAGTLELGVQAPQQVQSSLDESPVQGDTQSEMSLLTGRKPIEPESFRASEAVTLGESKTTSEPVSELDSPDQNRGGDCDNKGEEASECSTDSKVSSLVGSGQFLQGEPSSNGVTAESRQDNASSNSSNIQSEQTFHKEGGEMPTSVDKTQVTLQESIKQNFITETETLKRELQNVVEQKELVSNQLVFKAERQLEDADKVKSLTADLESIQQELNSVKAERFQLVEEFNLSQKDLQNTNESLAAELKASQEQVVAVDYRASLLFGELERSKEEVVEAGNKSAIEIESMQNLLKDGEVRISQFMEELVTTKTLLQGVQDEKASLNDELRWFENELHAHGGKLLQKGNELEASKQRIQTLEEDLASEHRALQQVQELVAEKSEMVEAGRVSNERLEALLSAKEVEFGAFGDQIRNMESEKYGLVHQVEDFKLQLGLAIQKEEGARAELEAQYTANQEQLKQLQDEKVELFDALEKSELLSKKLSDERSSLLAKFNADREQLEQDLRQKEEENLNQGKQLQEVRREFHKLGEEHSQVAMEIEIALDECRIAFDREIDEKSKAKLISARDQLLLLLEEKGQEVANLGNQLQEYQGQLRAKVEENSSLKMLLDESSGKLQETANLISEFEAEVKKQKVVSDGLLAEKEILAVQVLEFQAQRGIMQKTSKEFDLELERVREGFRVLQEDHSELSSQFSSTADKLTNVNAEKSAVELELATYKEQMTKLAEENSNLVKLLEDTRSDLQRVREDNLLSSSDLASELDKRKVLFSDLLVEKERLASELQLAIEESQNLQQELVQSGKEYFSELEELRNQLRELEDSHSKLLSDLTVSHKEMAKLKGEKSLAELELASSREQLTRLEDTTEDLRGALDRHKGQLDAVLEEKEKMLGDHVAELDRFRERQRDVEDAQTHQTAHLQHTESMFEESKELERKLKEDNVLLTTKLEDLREWHQNLLKDKVQEIEKLQQQVKELVRLQEQMAREVAETQERSQVLEGARLELLSNVEVLSQNLNSTSSEKDVLQRDLEFSKEQLKGLEEEKGNLILELEASSESWKVEKFQLSRDLEVSLENEKLVSAGKAQVHSEMTELMLKSHELDAQRVQLAMEVGALKESIKSSEEQRAHLVSQVEGKDRLLQTLVEEKTQLDSHLGKERERITDCINQVVQLEEDLGTAKLRIQELELETAQLKADFKYSQTQVELLTEERRKLLEDLSNHLSDDEKLKKAIEENLHLRDVREQLEGKQHELDTSFIRVDELESQVRELTGRVAHLQSEKDTALDAVFSTQEELRQSNNNLAGENFRLRVLEGTAAALQTERDELVGKLEVAEQSHTHLSERALEDSKDKLSLKDQLAAFEVRVAEYDIELKNQKDMLSQSNLLVQSLVQKLEDLIRDVFPKAGQDFLSLQYNKVSGDYHNSLVSKLHIETTEVYHQLQNADVQFFEMNQQLQAAKDQLMILQKERTVDIESAAQMRSQWMKAAKEKEELEATVKRLEATVSAENLRKNEQAVTINNLQLDRDELAGKLEIREQNHIHASERALQDSKDKVSLQNQVAAHEVQIAELNTELSNHKAMLIDSNLLVLSLVNKLEDLVREVSREAVEELQLSQYDKHTLEYHQILVSRLHEQKEMLTGANLLVLSLVNKLEVFVCEAFPEAGAELLSSQYDKYSPEYHHILVSRLHIETTEVGQRLKTAQDMFTRVEEQLAKAENALIILQKERTIAAESAEQIQSQLMKEIEGKEDLEISLKRLKAIHAENVRVDEQTNTLANQARREVESLVLQVESLNKQLEIANAEKESLQTATNTVVNQATSEVEGLVLQIESLNKQLENANAENENLQTALAEAAQKLSVTREKLSLAVNKGKAVVQQRDAWKLSLAEKSKELEMLVAGHQQDLENKDAAVNEAEKKIVDLTASVEQMARLEIQLDSFQSMLTTAEQVVRENENLFHTVSAMLDNGSFPNDWHSISIAKKMLWITGCLSTLQQELEARRKEFLTLMKHEATLTSCVEQSEAKVAAIAKQLRSVEHEKQDLVSKLEEASNELQLERAQMTEEKLQLTGIIRQQDLDFEMQKHEKENLATRLEERDKEIVLLEAEIASLVTKVTEQESDFSTQLLSYHRLDATLKTLFNNLSDFFEAISPVEIDKVSGDSSFDRCKYTVKLLMDNHNLTVGKLKEILGEAYLLSHASEGAAHDGVSRGLDDKASSKEMSSSLIETVDEALTNLEQQASSLAEEQNEKNRLQLELTQKEERLSVVREKLSAAVTKGKSLVQQRDSLKQTLTDKNAELETLAAAYKEELESKELSLQDASNRLASSLEHAAGLEKEIVSFQNSVATHPDTFPADRLSEMERELSATQHRANAAESEADNTRNKATVLSSELELSRTRLDNLVEQVKTLTEDKDELVQQLESSGNKYKSELQESIAGRAQLMSKISSLQQELEMEKEERDEIVQGYKEASDKCGELMNDIRNVQQELVLQKEERDKLVQDYKVASAKCGELMSEISTAQQELSTQKQERDELFQDYREASDKCGELRSQTEEIARARAMLLSETETFQQRIAELETALDREADARLQLESDMEAVVAMIQNSTEGSVMKKSLDSLTSSPYNSKFRSQLDSLGTSLVLKFEAALQEIEELSKQKALLAESQQTMMEKALSEREMLEQLQQRVASMNLELSEAFKKLEEADSKKEMEEAASKGFLEEVHMVREDLARASSERDALRSELVQIEQKGAITREKLGLAIKKGKGVAHQRDLLKQSLSEQQSLVATYKDELQIKDSALIKATDELYMCEEKVRALELNVSSLNSFVSTLEQELQDKYNLTKEMEAVLTKWDFPIEWQSRDITEKLEWLVAALSNAQNSLIVAGQERDALKEAYVQLTAELTDAQTRANLEQESRSMLGVKLEECLGSLQQSRNQIAELETLLAEVGGVSQQTERLSRELLDLKKSLEHKQTEVKSAEEAVMAWVKRSEESEKYIQLCQARISELEKTVEESRGVQQQTELLQDKIARLEEAVQQKEASVKAVETSRGKAVNKLTLTTNKFRELYRQSEGLVAELERMHHKLQEKDAEIIQLKEGAVKISSQNQILQEALGSKRSFQLQLEKLLETAVLAGADSALSPPRTAEDSDPLAEGKTDEERCIGHVHFLQNQVSGLTVQLQGRQADVERKDVHLQGLRKELDEVGAEKAQLKANLQREQIQSERLKAEVAAVHASFTEKGTHQAEEIEEVQIGKRLLPVNPPTPHVRGTRRPTLIDVAIDVDSEMNQSLVEFDDKGHGFKSLTSSRFMPRGTRAIGEQIDRLCVAGGRLLMRQPAARLLVTLYWLAIHIWMVFLITAVHI